MTIQQDIAAAQTAIAAVSDASTKAALTAVLTAVSNRVDVATHLRATDGYTGAEISASTPDADPNSISLPGRTSGAVYSQIDITTSTLPDATHGVAYSQQLAATGGVTGGLTWAVDSRTPLPAGLTLSTAGLLSGTPTTEGASSFIITVTDTAGNSVSARFGMTAA